MGDIFSPDRTKYLLPSGLAELIDDARAFLGDEFEECDSQETGEVLAHHLKGATEMTLTDFMNLFKRLRSTKRIKSNEELAEEESAAIEQEPTGPVVDGRSDFEIFYATKTAREIRERIAAEPAFAKYARTQMAAEVQQSGDGVASTATAEVHPALKKFAQQYIQTPSGQLRPVMGYVSVMDGTRFTLQKFNQLVAEASAGKLI
jgi:hypothetical protein